MPTERVLLLDCPDYDRARITALVRDAVRALTPGLGSRVFVKPNAVFGTRAYARTAHTHPDVIAGVLGALDPGTTAVLGEDCGLLVPTRYVFHQAGYDRVAREFGARLCYLEEVRHDRVVTLPRGRVHRRLHLPARYVDADRIFVPKLKRHCQTTISNALKLAIGIVPRSLRLCGHDHRLDQKIVDLLPLGPGLVVTDAVEIGIGGAGVPRPGRLGLLIIGRNPVAVDATAARVLGLEPSAIAHLRLAQEQGYGTLAATAIALDGDVTLAQARARARSLPAEPSAPGSICPEVDACLGRFPDGRDQCTGGCVGFAAEALHFIDQYRAGRVPTRGWFASAVAALLNPRTLFPRRLVLVLGDCRGQKLPGDAAPLLIGDCARIDRGRRASRVRGCPVYMGSQVWAIAQRAGVANPYLDIHEAAPFIGATLVSWFWRRLRGTGSIDARAGQDILSPC